MRLHVARNGSAERGLRVSTDVGRLTWGAAPVCGGAPLLASGDCAIPIQCFHLEPRSRSRLVGTARAPAAAVGWGGGPILVTQPNPVHRVGQTVFMPAEMSKVQIVIGRVHHVQAAGITRVGVENGSCLVTIEHAYPRRFLDAEIGGSEIINPGS